LREDGADDDFEARTPGPPMLGAVSGEQGRVVGAEKSIRGFADRIETSGRMRRRSWGDRQSQDKLADRLRRQGGAIHEGHDSEHKRSSQERRLVNCGPRRENSAVQRTATTQAALPDWGRLGSHRLKRRRASALQKSVRRGEMWRKNTLIAGTVLGDREWRVQNEGKKSNIRV